MGEPRPTNAPEIHGSAEFSDCGEHRTRLDRWWSDEPRALIGMVNPSKAGADRNDPTICTLNRLLYGRPGIGGYTVVNADDRIATDPRALAIWLRQTDIATVNRMCAAMQRRPRHGSPEDMVEPRAALSRTGESTEAPQQDGATT